jgi:hypothetical protein
MVRFHGKIISGKNQFPTKQQNSIDNNASNILLSGFFANPFTEPLPSNNKGKRTQIKGMMEGIYELCR